MNPVRCPPHARPLPGKSESTPAYIFWRSKLSRNFLVSYPLCGIIIWQLTGEKKYIGGSCSLYIRKSSSSSSLFLPKLAASELVVSTLSLTCLVSLSLALMIPPRWCRIPSHDGWNSLLSLWNFWYLQMETVFCSNKVSILFIHRDIHRSLMAKNEASDSCIGLGSVDHCDSFFFGRPVFSAMILRGKDGHLSPWLAPVSLFFFSGQKPDTSGRIGGRNHVFWPALGFPLLTILPPSPALVSPFFHSFLILSASDRDRVHHLSRVRWRELFVGIKMKKP